MNRAKCTDQDYIQFLIATPRNYSCTEAAQVFPESERKPAHDAFTRLIHREEPNTDKLWLEAEPYIEKTGGIIKLMII